MRWFTRLFTRGPVMTGKEYKVFCNITLKWYKVLVIKHLPKRRVLVTHNAGQEILKEKDLRKI